MIQRKQFYYVFYALVLLSFNMLTSCKDPAIDREVEPSEISVLLTRIDQKLFHGGQSLEETHEELLSQYPEFYQHYYADVLQLGDPKDSGAVSRLQQFVTYPEWVYTQEQIDSVFPSVAELEQQFEQAFGRYKKIFPKKKAPQIFMINTGYNYGVYPVLQGPFLGIGPEFFLGADNPMVKRLPNEIFPNYLRKQMNPEQLIPSVMKGWLLSTYDEPPAKVDLLNLMVTYGKIMYTLHICVPDIPEYLHFSYSMDQFKWCQEHEEDIWAAIVKDKLLYTSDRKTLTDWTGRGPYSRGFSEESPAEIAYFMGKQMVKDYMRGHPEVSVEELVLVPATVILRSYTPS